MKNKEKMTQLWFVLKNEERKKEVKDEVPLFRYDENLTYFISGEQALHFLDILLGHKDLEEKRGKENFLAWEKYLEGNIVIPQNKEKRQEMSERIEKGLREPIPMPWDVRMAGLMVDKIKDLKGFKAPEDYPLAVSFPTERGETLYVPVHYLLTWLKEWKIREGD